MVTVGIIGAGRIGKVHVESICTKVADAKVKIGRASCRERGYLTV